MLICRTNTDSMLYIHEATCKTDGLLIGSLGFNPNTLPRGESSRRPFLLPIASVTGAIDKHESAEPEQRQGKLNNRDAFPRSGRLTDYTREFVTWVMRLQANYRIEQPVLRNVVLIGRLGLFSLRVGDGIKGGLKAIYYGSYHPCITYEGII